MNRKKLLSTLFAAAAAAAAYAALPADCPEPARRTGAVFVLAAFFWALEVIPLFATSLLVILLLILSLAKPGGVMGMDENGYQIFLLPLSNPVILLFLGGFVLAAMMSKYGFDRLLVGRLMGFFGDRPYFILLGFIFATAFLSLWMSHTASTAIMLAIVMPVLLHLDSKDPFRKALVLAVPFSANIGGIGTPVGTPPNAIAVGVLAEEGIRVPFLEWMRMAVPLALVLLVIASAVLYLMFPPAVKRLSLKLACVENPSPRAWGALAIGAGTVGLWLTSAWHGLPESVVALLSVALFATLGFLRREDLNKIHWDILILMWGGLALGKAMEISGLGRWVVGLPLFAGEGFALVAAFCLVTVVVSIFVSNTATANLLLPLAMSAPGGEKVVLAVIVAISSSFDMLLPISTPSNALAFSTNLVSVKDMIRSGAVIVAIAVVLILAGYPYFIGPLVR